MLKNEDVEVLVKQRMSKAEVTLLVTTAMIFIVFAIGVYSLHKTTQRQLQMETQVIATVPAGRVISVAFSDGVTQVETTVGFFQVRSGFQATKGAMLSISEYADGGKALCDDSGTVCKKLVN